MALLETPAGNYGWKAAAFSLPGTDGLLHTPESVRGPKGLLVMFISNHCPYVKAIVGKLVEDVRQLQEDGIGCIAVMPNDVIAYPEDSLENMRKFAAQNQFSFPYAIDETQQAAKMYGAVCTPDFFGFNAKLELQYRGRLDEAGSGHSTHDNPKRELLLAMQSVAMTGECTRKQMPSMGCSIKWKAGI